MFSKKAGLTVFLSALSVITHGGFASGGEFAFLMENVEVRPGAAFALSILADAPQAYQGLSLTVRFPSEDLRVERWSVKDTIVEAIGADFVHGEVIHEKGIFILGILADASPPFDGTLFPAPGFPLVIGRLHGLVLRQSPGSIPLEFLSGGERPAVETLFSVDNVSRRPSLLVGGRVQITPTPLVPAFIRGDATLDREIDIADALSILDSQFHGGAAPACELAADANSDDALDLTDAVFLLRFLFIDGPRPLPPQKVPGENPRRKSPLTCLVPLEWLRERN